MKKLLFTLLFCISSSWGQEFSLTGLELEPISNFGVLVESLTDDGIKMGLNRKSIEAKVKLALRKNGTPSSLGATAQDPYLYINIFVREDETISGRSLGYSVSINIEFKRLVVYSSSETSSGNTYYKFASVWHLPRYNLALSNDPGGKKRIMDDLTDRLGRFSIELLETNNK